MTMSAYPKFKVCAAHVAPVFLDAAATVEKACALIAEASRAGARLIAFPESFVPGFPVWAAVQAPIKSHDFFKRLAANSIEVPGPEVAALCAAARDNAIVVSIGISERSPVSVGCLWNTNLLIDGDGNLINHHRKLVPTFYEKLIWANGDGEGLRVSSTRHRQDRHVDLRREYQPARALFTDCARRTGAHFILSAGLADTPGQ